MRCVWAFSCLMLSALTACAPPKSENQPAAMGPGGSASEVGSSRDAGPSRPAPVAGKIEADDATAPNLADVPFTLRDQTGQDFSSSQLEGKVWMGAIFFANCPGPCFRENQEIADILRKIDDRDFMVVSLTCDPENDTPEALATYAGRFEADPARWKFLTGDLKLIEKVGQRVFRLPVELGVHSERGVVFDRQGRLRGGYHLLQPDRVDLLVKLIRDVLAERADAVGDPSETAAEVTP